MLIRDVPEDDLDEIRAAAAEAGTSVQRYLRDGVRSQAAHRRRQAALVRTAERLRDRTAVPEEERSAVLEAIDADHQERSGRLGRVTR